VDISQFLLAIIPTVLILYVPLLHENMYIPYCFITLLMHLSTVRYLHATSERPDHPSKEEGVEMVSSPSLAGTLDTSFSGSDQSLPLFNPVAATPVPSTTTTPSITGAVGSHVSIEHFLLDSNVPEKLETRHEIPEGIGGAHTLEEEQPHHFDVC